MPGKFEHEKILRGIYARSNGAGVCAMLAARIIRRETDKPGEAGNPRGCKRYSRRHRIGIGSGGSGKEVGHVEPRRLTEEHNGDEWRLEAQLVDRADILADVVDAVTAAQCGGVVAEDIPGKPHARSPSGGDAVAEGGAGATSRQTRHSQLVDATGIDERIGSGLGEIRFDVANVTTAVSPRSQEFSPQAQVQREIGRCLPVVLHKHSRVVLPVFVVVYPSPAKPALRLAPH